MFQVQSTYSWARIFLRRLFSTTSSSFNRNFTCGKPSADGFSAERFNLMVQTRVLSLHPVEFSLPMLKPPMSILCQTTFTWINSCHASGRLKMFQNAVSKCLHRKNRHARTSSMRRLSVIQMADTLWNYPSSPILYRWETATIKRNADSSAWKDASRAIL